MIAVEENAEKRLYLLKATEIEHYWPQIMPELATSGMYECWTDEQLFSRCTNGAMQVWALSDGTIRLILVTDIIVYQNGRRALRFVGGFGRELDSFLDTAIAGFRKVVTQLNCDEVEVIGRKAWVRKLRRLAFKHKFSVYTLEVKDGR